MSGQALRPYQAQALRHVESLAEAEKAELLCGLVVRVSRHVPQGEAHVVNQRGELLGRLVNIGPLPDN